MPTPVILDEKPMSARPSPLREGTRGIGRAAHLVDDQAIHFDVLYNKNVFISLEIVFID